MAIRFEKMHGLGNDFIIIDERNSPMQLVSSEQRAQEVQEMANRKTGIGCDQLAIMRPSSVHDAYIQIYNADGSESAACGNVTRCIAWLLMREKRTDCVTIDTEAGSLECRLVGQALISVNMRRPKLKWHEIPLLQKYDTISLPMESGILKNPVAVNIGNPHAVFFVDEVGAVPLKKLGAELECDILFPEKANIGVAQVDSRTHITLRVWERGTGETQACGTGACAAVVAARRRGLVDEKVTVLLPGGELQISWAGDEENQDKDVWMTGPVSHVFSGEISDDKWV